MTQYLLPDWYTMCRASQSLHGPWVQILQTRFLTICVEDVRPKSTRRICHFFNWNSVFDIFYDYVKYQMMWKSNIILFISFNEISFELQKSLHISNIYLLWFLSYLLNIYYNFNDSNDTPLTFIELRWVESYIIFTLVIILILFFWWTFFY